MDKATLREEDFRTLEEIYNNDFLDKSFGNVGEDWEFPTSLERLKESGLVVQTKLDETTYRYFTTKEGSEKVENRLRRQTELETNKILAYLTAILSVIAGLDILTTIYPKQYNLIFATSAALLMISGAVMGIKGLRV